MQIYGFEVSPDGATWYTSATGIPSSGSGTSKVISYTGETPAAGWYWQVILANTGITYGGNPIAVGSGTIT